MLFYPSLAQAQTLHPPGVYSFRRGDIEGPGSGRAGNNHRQKALAPFHLHFCSYRVGVMGLSFPMERLFENMGAKNAK